MCIIRSFTIFKSYTPLIVTVQCCCCCSVAKPCPTLCGPRHCSMPGFPVLHHFPESPFPGVCPNQDNINHTSRVVQHILQLILYTGLYFLNLPPLYCPSPFSLPTSYHWFVLCICEFASFLLYSLAVVFRFHIEMITCPSLSDLFHLVKQDFPDGSDNKESACKAGDPGSIPGLGRFFGGENGNPLQSSGLENSMDRGAWRAAVQGVTKSQTRLRD